MGMNEQKFIIEDSAKVFRDKINSNLSNGWRMIPESLRIATTGGDRYGDHEYFSCVMEKFKRDYSREYEDEGDCNKNSQ